MSLKLRLLREKKALNPPFDRQVQNEMHSLLGRYLFGWYIDNGLIMENLLMLKKVSVLEMISQQAMF